MNKPAIWEPVSMHRDLQNVTIIVCVRGAWFGASLACHLAACYSLFI